MKKTLLSLALAASFIPSISQAAPPLSFTKEWTYQHDIASEILSFDAVTNSFWVTGETGIDILNLNTGLKTGYIDVSPFGRVNSVDVHNGVAALAIENEVRSDNGFVQFYDTSSQSLLKQVSVGALPDMVKFNADGTRLLVANEGTPDQYGAAIGEGLPQKFAPAANDPAGTVSVIDTSSDIKDANVIATAGFDGVAQTGAHIRTDTGMDFEPEYIAVNEAGTKAYVSLQEANAVGVLNLETNEFDKVIGLGAKDFSAAGNEIDVSDKDGEIKFASQNIKGLYMPDAIESYDANGQTYIVTANEGDFREDDGDAIRAGKLGLAAPLDRINVSTTDSTADDLFIPGARSFSIFDENGGLVFDSGNQLEVEAAKLGIYNDGRSDNKGVEPEGVALLDIFGSTYAFVGLERTTKSAIAVYDVTNPLQSLFLTMLVSDDDLSPEGIEAFTTQGRAYLSFSNEKSNTTSLYSLSVSEVPVPAAAFLFAPALIGLMGLRRKVKHTVA